MQHSYRWWFKVVVFPILAMILFGYMLTTEPPEFVTFLFVFLAGGGLLVLSYQQGVIDATKWCLDEDAKRFERNLMRDIVEDVTPTKGS